MRGLAGLVVLFAAFGGAAAVDAPASPTTDFESSRALKPFTFDVKEGNYQSQNVPIDCATNAIWLKAHFTRLGKPITKWAPGMTLSVESTSTRAAVQIVADNYQPPFHVVIVIVNLKDEKDIDQVALYNTFDLETPAPVLASWSSDGAVTFNVKGETRTVNLKGPALQASLIGSTGAGVFDPLETGRLTGTNPEASCPKPKPRP